MRKADIRDIFEFMELNGIHTIESKSSIKEGKDGRKYEGTALRIDRDLTEKEKEMVHKAWSNVIVTKTFCEYAPEIIKNWIICYPYTIRHMMKTTI